MTIVLSFNHQMLKQEIAKFELECVVQLVSVLQVRNHSSYICNLFNFQIELWEINNHFDLTFFYHFWIG